MAANIENQAAILTSGRADTGGWPAERRAGLAGVAFAVAFVVWFFVPGVPPDLDAPVTDMRAYLTDNSTVMLTHLWLGGLVLGVLLPVFAVTLYGVAANGDGSISPLLLLVASITITATTIAGGGMFWLLGAWLAPGGLGDDSVRILFSGDLLVYTVFVAWGMALFAAAAASALRRRDMLPTWLGGSGFAVAALLAVGASWVVTADTTGPLATISFAATSIWILWVLAASIALIRHSRH